MSTRTISVVMLGFSLLLFAAGCKKKVPPPPPPPPKPEIKETPPPPPPRPMISRFVAEPSTIERGQSATLQWTVSHATDVSIDRGIGAVQAEGSRQVFPSATTMYTLTAKGPGGTASAEATVQVTVPPPPPPPPAPKKRSFSEVLSAELHDAYFDFDKYNIREDARTALTQDAGALKSILRDFPGEKVVIEGHCDERGSAEYNLGLGERRSTSAKNFLTELGVPADRLSTISYGKERPQCTDHTEQCWQLNRHVHFSAGQ